MNALSLPFLVGIFLGGGAGSVLRHLLGVWLNGRHLMPLGTLAANLLATGLLAAVTLKLATRFPEGHVLPAALAIGLCGGFSTFSTISACLTTSGRLRSMNDSTSSSISCQGLATPVI